MQVNGSHETIMGRQVVFCVLVDKVGATRFPVDKELALYFTISDPVEVHIDHLWSFLLDEIVGKPFFRWIIDEEKNGRLWVDKFA